VNLYRLVFKVLATRGRIALSAVLGGLVVVAAIAVSAGSGPSATLVGTVIAETGLGLLAPVVSLVFASAALGDFVEDGTLVYLWLRPVPRWKLVVPALAAAVTIAGGLVATPLVIASLASGRGLQAAGAAAVASLLAVLAYGGIGLAVSLRTRRILLWGLAYVLVWENGAARVSEGLSSLAISRYTTSVLAGLGGADDPEFGVGLPVALFVLVVIALGTVAWANRLLRRQDVA